MNKTSEIYAQTLIIEDDAALALIISKKLQALNLNSTIVYDGKLGAFEAMSGKYSLLIIDVGLPEMNGLEIVKKVRTKDLHIPMIIITNQLESDNEVESFNKGADLYHEKPINFTLLEAQVKSLLKARRPISVITIGDLYLEPGKRILRKNERSIKLSNKEYELVLMLIQARGEILSRTEIIKRTLKGVKDPQSGSVDTLVSRIRRKLGEFEGRPSIETVHGVGFRLGSPYLQG